MHANGPLGPGRLPSDAEVKGTERSAGTGGHDGGGWVVMACCFRSGVVGKPVARPAPPIGPQSPNFTTWRWRTTLVRTNGELAKVSATPAQRSPSWHWTQAKAVSTGTGNAST